jgi:hypothetical protein
VTAGQRLASEHQHTADDRAEQRQDCIPDQTDITSCHFLTAWGAKRATTTKPARSSYSAGTRPAASVRRLYVVTDCGIAGSGTGSPTSPEGGPRDQPGVAVPILFREPVASCAEQPKRFALFLSAYYQHTEGGSLVR